MHTQTSEYAMRAMAWLALTPSELTATPTLAERTQVPPHYLSKVLQQLSAAEPITGRRGVGGGYKLSKPAGEITLLDVLNAVATVQRITKCPLGLKNHSVLCPLHTLSDKVAEAVIEIYSGQTLQDLIDSSSSSMPLCDTQTTTQLTVSKPQPDSD